MIGPEVTVPDLTEAIVGYRRFALRQSSQHNYKLFSPHTKNTAWDKPEMRAKCNVEIPVPEGLVLPHPPKPHSAPAKDCGCGIYAYFDPCPVHPIPSDYYHYSMHPRDTEVAALMVLEGRIEVHSRGMRAAKARICALGVNGNIKNDELAGLKEIAKRWDIPLVEQDALPRLAPEYGRALGADLRPVEPTVELTPRPAHPSPEAAVEYVTLPMREERRKRSVLRWLPASINGSASAVNLGMFCLNPSPISVMCAAASAGLAGYYVRKELA